LKNGILNTETYLPYVLISLDSKLKYICVDLAELNQITDISKRNKLNCEINPYCTFTPGGNFNTISGKSLLDINDNGCDVSDVLFPDLKMKSESLLGTSYTFSTKMGVYNFYPPTGNFTITPEFENPTYFITPPSIIVSFLNSNNNQQTADFCITPNGTKNDVEVKFIPTLGVRTGEIGYYQLIYKNKGNRMLSGSVNVAFNDAVLDFISASQIPTTSLGNLSWNYTDLKPFETRTINFTMQLNSQVSSPPLVIGDILNFTATINPILADEMPADNTFSFNQLVVGAYDPNDKTCLQGTSITPDLVGNYIDYLIRYTNEGTDFARNIVVKDIIDTEMFDISTLQVMSSGHSVRTEISNGNKVEFIFENIELAGKYDEPNSHGFVTFKIKTKPTVKIGDILKNKADIYFDYNLPEATNLSETKIENLNSEEIIQNSKFKISFTNPAKDKITFTQEVKSVSVFDLSGKLVQNSIVNGTEMNVFSLKTGNYILKISTENGTFTEKLVKN